MNHELEGPTTVESLDSSMTEIHEVEGQTVDEVSTGTGTCELEGQTAIHAIKNAAAHICKVEGQNDGELSSQVTEVYLMEGQSSDDPIVTPVEEMQEVEGQTNNESHLNPVHQKEGQVDSDSTLRPLEEVCHTEEQTNSVTNVLQLTETSTTESQNLTKLSTMGLSNDSLKMNSASFLTESVGESHNQECEDSETLDVSDTKQTVEETSKFSVETVVMTRNFSLLEQYGTSSSSAETEESNPDSESDSDSSSTESKDSDSDSSVSTESSSSEYTSYTDEIKSTPAKKQSQPKAITKGELLLEDLPPIENLCISVARREIQQIGVVSAVVDRLVVVQAFKNSPALDLDSILFLEEGKPLGQVFDVFGQVVEPLYAVRFNSKEEIDAKGIRAGLSVFWAPQRRDVTSFVFLEQLKKMRGSDASWEHNNEPPEDAIDYSDDEQERLAKQRLKKKGQITHADSNGKAPEQRRIKNYRPRNDRQLVQPARFEHFRQNSQETVMPHEESPAHISPPFSQNWTKGAPPQRFACLPAPPSMQSGTTMYPKGNLPNLQPSNYQMLPGLPSLQPSSGNLGTGVCHRPLFPPPGNTLMHNTHPSNNFQYGGPSFDALHPPLQDFKMHRPMFNPSRPPPIPFVPSTFDVTRRPPCHFPPPPPFSRSMSFSPASSSQVPLPPTEASSNAGPISWPPSSPGPK